MRSRELSRQSPHASGPVQSNEELLRILFFPDHTKENGELKPEAIPTEDLASRGFSVQRRPFLQKKTIEILVKNYVARKPERKCVGIASTECEKVRDIKDYSEQQAFVVLDDAREPEQTAHAVIRFADDYSRSVRKALREKMLRIFNQIAPLDSYI